MKLNTIVRTKDGRIGTICYHNLDGCGGIWGEHEFAMPPTGFSDDLPTPEFMLRDERVEAHLRDLHGNPGLECVGDDYDIVAFPASVEEVGRESATT